MSARGLARRLALATLVFATTAASYGCSGMDAGNGNLALGGIRGHVTAKTRAGTEPPAPAPTEPSGKKKKGQDPYAAPEPPKDKKAPPPPPPPRFPRIDYGSLPEIVVWVEPAPGAARPSREEAEAPAALLSTETVREQVTLELDDPSKPSKGARVIARGSLFKITNLSDETLTIFSVSEGNGFDSGPLRPGESFEWRPAASGVVELLCDEFAAWKHALVVVPTLRHAELTSGRMFRFDDLPLGVYRVSAWHWRLPSAIQTVEVHAAKWASAELTLSVDALGGAEERPLPGGGPGAR